MKPRESMTFGALFYDSFPLFKVIYGLFGKGGILTPMRKNTHRYEKIFP
jgi:hypothetical protein